MPSFMIVTLNATEFLFTPGRVTILNDGDAHVVEHIHLVEADHLVDDLVIEAPHVLAQPWRVTRNFTRNRERRFDIVEGTCRQGDFIEGKDAQGHAAFVPLQHDDGARIAADLASLHQ